MIMENELVEKRVECAPIQHVDICETNRNATVCVGRKCYLLEIGETLEKREIYASETSYLVAAFWANPTKVLCVCHSGEIVEIAIFEEIPPEVTASTRLPVKNIIYAYFISEGEKLYLLDDSGQLLRVHSDCTTQLVVKEQFATGDEFAITDSYYVHVRNAEIRMAPLEKGSGVVADSIRLKQRKEHTNHFVRVCAREDYVAAATENGRVLIWSDVRSKGFKPGYFDFAWHQTAPHLCLSAFGNVLTGGSEAVLCRSSKVGKPSFLPRLSCAVMDLKISPDSSHIICVLEDNSLHVVLASTLTRLSSTTFIRLIGPFKDIFMSDPRIPNSIILPGRVGAISWANPLSEKITNTTSISLENNALLPNSQLFSVSEARHELMRIALSHNRCATLEYLVGLKDEFLWRLRFWSRQKSDPTELKLLDTIELSEDSYEIAGYTVDHVQENFVLGNKLTGTLQLWRENGEKSGWSYETIYETKMMQIESMSSINSAHLLAVAQSYHGSYCVSVVNVEEKRALFSIPCSGPVTTVAFASTHLLLISTTLNVFCFDVEERMLRWEVSEAFKIYVTSEGGCFVYDKNQAIEIDFSTGVSKRAFEFSAQIQKLVAFSNGTNLPPTLIGLTDKSFHCLYPSGLASSPPTSATLMTPFASLALIKKEGDDEAAVVDPFSSHPLQPTRKHQSAMQLLAAPVHTLPPIGNIAPGFIASCLLPPPPAAISES